MITLNSPGYVKPEFEPAVTTNPWEHNKALKHDKRLDQITKDSVHIVQQDGGRTPRKRKKYVYREERAAYKVLLALVFLYLSQQTEH